MNIRNYLDPRIPPNIKRVAIPIVEASNDSLRGCGCLVDSPDDFPVHIVRWPARGWRPVDHDSGDEAGTTQGVFVSEWRGDFLYGKNEAVGGHYILGYGAEPALARDDHTRPPTRLMLWHANYHPDGGQLFFPLDRGRFWSRWRCPAIISVLNNSSASTSTANRALHPPGCLARRSLRDLRHPALFDKQGAVHARVSVDFPREFGCLLEIDLNGVRM